MKFTNSSLVSATRISPNRTSPRNQPITKITPHHMAGVCTIEQFGNLVANPSRQMSANYGIGNDGRMILTCPEGDRSWCSSSPWNDHRAVTIEVSNSAYGDASGWPISDAAYKSLIALCVDICKRNNIPKLVFTGDTSGSLTFHYMYTATACPGPWLKAHAQDLCNKVNAQLNAINNKPTVNNNKTSSQTTTTTSKIVKDDLVTISASATYYDGGSIPQWVKDDKWYVSSISGDRAVLGLNEAKNRNIQSPVNTKFLSVVKTSTQKTYTVSLKSTDILYASPGGNTKGTVGTTGVFTIIEEQTTNGIKYGKLKSGAGWVKLTTTTTTTTASTAIKVGDWVKVTNNITYDGKKFTVYASKYKVLELNGKRAVISSDGKNVTCAINTANIVKV